MTITQLQVLVKTIDTGSFTKASQALNMTQPAVSHAISNLEADLGVKLLLRDRKRGLILTDIGERILVHTRAILNHIEKVEQEIAAEKGFEVGTIKIGSFPSASTQFLPKIIKVFKQKYPSLQLNVHEGTLDEIKGWLKSKVIDIGFIVLPSKGMDTVPIAKDEMVVLVPKTHALSKKNSISINDLDNEPLILCRGGFESPIIDMFNKAKVKLRAEFTVSHINTLLKMIQEDLGLAIAPRFSLTSVPIGIAIKKLEPEFCREIALAIPDLKEASIAVKLFIKEMRNLENEFE
ncbi:LysR family transcriptional regulator [Priestia megaterium]|uniref:LysR family transcriptional regulator n=1 Tax=Priestia megaterium TaxID=1404 RepID=UPI002363FF96|nr:LysR family transcriptional regulator [Priestia megaterium]MDD1515719.1 LysR family transcriptional regulator [Priestia megaterium]